MSNTVFTIILESRADAGHEPRERLKYHFDVTTEETGVVHLNHAIFKNSENLLAERYDLREYHYSWYAAPRDPRT